MLGPIFRIELLTTARRARHFLVRVVYGLILLVALWSVYESNVGWNRAIALQEIANVASQYFQVFAVLQMLVVLLVGPAVAAGAVAVERERRTIEYLFATDLSNAEIVIGKLVARTMQVTWYLLTGLPVLAIAMLMGGIGPEQLAIVFLLTVATLVSVNVLSVAVSVWAPRVRDAFRRVYFLLFVLVILPLILWPMVTRSLGPGSPLASLFDILVALNPVWMVFQSLVGVGFWTSGNPWPAVWMFVGGHVAGSVCLAAAAVWAVRRVHLAGDGKPVRAKRTSAVRARRGPGNHPMLWKELLAARTGNRLGSVGRVLVAVAAIGCLTPSVYAAMSWQNPRDSGMVTLMMSTLLASVSLLMLGARAAASITGEKERDTWVTLMSTPLAGREILWGKFVGTLVSMRGALVLVGLVWAMQIFLQPLFAIGVALSLTVIGVVAAAVVCTGLAYSLRARNTTRATGMTLFTLVLVGGGYSFCCIPVVSGPDSETLIALVVPFLIGAPQAMVQELIENPNNPYRYDWIGRTAAICVVGAIAYAAIGGVLWAWLTSAFERAVGRTMPRAHRSAPPLQPPIDE